MYRFIHFFVIFLVGCTDIKQEYTEEDNCEDYNGSIIRAEGYYDSLDSVVSEMIIVCYFDMTFSSIKNGSNLDSLITSFDAKIDFISDFINNVIDGQAIRTLEDEVCGMLAKLLVLVCNEY